MRYNTVERVVHWMTATCFIVLALTGLNITFGKSLLLPLIGPEAFSAWSQWGKYAHNYLSFPFTIGVFLIFLMWIAGNIPNRVDVEWLKRGGGIVGHDHPPAYRFNAGQKMIYWIVVLGGTAVAVSGYVLMFPFYGTGIASMQAAQITHAIVAVLFIAAMIHAFQAWKLVPRTPAARRARHLALLVTAQAGIGIATLVAVVPLDLALLHQFGAAVVLWAAVAHRRALNEPTPITA